MNVAAELTVNELSVESERARSPKHPKRQEKSALQIVFDLFKKKKVKKK